MLIIRHAHLVLHLAAGEGLEGGVVGGAGVHHRHRPLARPRPPAAVRVQRVRAQLAGGPLVVRGVADVRGAGGARGHRVVRGRAGEGEARLDVRERGGVGA